MHAHWIDDDEPLDQAALAAEGVTYQRLDTEPAAYRGPLDALRAAQGYIQEDEVALSAETPDLEAIRAKFWDEHRHTEDEVRFVLEGEGVFDIRSRDDRWMRVTVTAGDLIVVPKDRHHRFALTELELIRCVRLFKDTAGWTAIYRPGEAATR